MNISENPVTLYQTPDGKISLDVRLEIEKSNMQKLHIANSDVQRGLEAGGHHQTVVWAIVGAIHESPLHESPLHESPLHESPLHESPLHESPLPPQPHRQPRYKKYDGITI